MARPSSPDRPRARRVTCFGVGYEKLAPRALCELLLSHDVMHVVDVRQSAWSYRQEYRKGALRGQLEAAGIKYTHLPEAGNPYRPKVGETKEFAACRREYARHIGRQPDVLDTVARMARRERIALLCYERDGRCCHRSILVSEVRRRVGHMAYVELREPVSG